MRRCHFCLSFFLPACRLKITKLHTFSFMQLSRYYSSVWHCFTYINASTKTVELFLFPGVYCHAPFYYIFSCNSRNGSGCQIVASVGQCINCRKHQTLDPAVACAYSMDMALFINNSLLLTINMQVPINNSIIFTFRWRPRKEWGQQFLQSTEKKW